MSKQRFTVEVLASGQPRAYADTIHHVRVTFETSNWLKANGDLEPMYMTEERAREMIKALPLTGWVEKTKKDCEWWETRLDWLKPIDAKLSSDVIPYGDPKQTVANIWEFHTTSPFTD